MIVELCWCMNIFNCLKLSVIIPLFRSGFFNINIPHFFEGVGVPTVNLLAILFMWWVNGTDGLRLELEQDFA